MVVAANLSRHSIVLLQIFVPNEILHRVQFSLSAWAIHFHFMLKIIPLVRLAYIPFTICGLWKELLKITANFSDLDVWLLSNLASHYNSYSQPACVSVPDQSPLGKLTL